MTDVLVKDICGGNARSEILYVRPVWKSELNHVTSKQKVI